MRPSKPSDQQRSRSGAERTPWYETPSVDWECNFRGTPLRCEVSVANDGQLPGRALLLLLFPSSTTGAGVTILPIAATTFALTMRCGADSSCQGRNRLIL